MIDPELAGLVDELCAEHPAFRRSTVERLVARVVRELHAAQRPVTPSAVRHEAGDQLTYVDDGEPGGRLRFPG